MMGCRADDRLEIRWLADRRPSRRPTDMALRCAPPVNRDDTFRRAAGESTPRPAARRLEGPAGRAAAARQLQRLVGQRARLLAKKRNELLNGDASFSDQSTQGALGELSVIGDGEAAIRGLGLPEDDVASPLAIDLVSEPAKGRHRLPPRDPR